MIMIAVTSLGLAFNKWSERDFFIYNGPFNRFSPPFRWFNTVMWNILPHLTLWSLAISAIGLHGRRGSAREMVGRPGTAACWAASLSILFEMAWYLPFKIGHPDGVRSGIVIVNCCESVAPAVAGAWLVCLAGGLWKAERDWVDRVGRAVGVTWIANLVFFNFRNLFL